MNKKQVAAAQKEGWAIFEAGTSQCNEQGNWPYQVQRCDESGVLDTDEMAHRLIVAGAKEGKPHSIAALTFLRENSKPELELILRAETGGVDSYRDCLRTNDLKLDELETQVFGKIITKQGE